MSFWSKLKNLFGAAPADASAPTATVETPSPKDLFADEVKRALVASGATIVRYDREEFSIVGKRGGSEFTVFLENVFRETRDLQPDQRAARISALGSIGVQSDDLAWEDAKERLVPLVRPVTMFAAVEGRPGAKPIVSRPFAPFLIEAMAIDSPTSMAMVTREQLERWGVDEATLFDQGHAVLGAAGAAVAPYDPTAPYALFTIANDDSYESSRLALPELLEKLAEKVDGRLVAVVPGRAMLLIGGDGALDCLRRLIETAERQYESSPRSISPAPYTLEGGKVVPYHAAPDHPLARTIEIAHAKLALREYETQKPLLQAKVGDDVFVASFSALDGPDGVTSYSVWSRGIPTLLPKTTHVVLSDGETATPARVEWSAIEAFVTEVPGVAPPRYRTEEWPTAAFEAATRSR